TTVFLLFFFFSSRRRHTRSKRDWSSDVCSSDLEDIEGMKYAQGILTVRGGQTSHAAVVARGMGTCCVSGCGDIKMDEENKQFTLDRKSVVEGKRVDSGERSCETGKRSESTCTSD